MKIFILGDFMLGRYMYPLLKKEGLKKYLEKVSYKWENAIAIANLESPLIKNHYKALKKVNPLGVNEDIIEEISKINISAFSLANNHIYDFGRNGILNTINLLKKNKIGFFGAGLNIDLALRPFIIKKDNLTIGFLSFSYSNIATKKQSGTADLYSPNIFNQVKDLKSYVDFVIVINHAGIELLKHPLPRDQKIFRKIIDFGADVVIGSHSHCVQTMENYNGKTIYYGIGDLVYDSFEKKVWGKYWTKKAHAKIFNIPAKKEETGYSLIIEINFQKNNFYTKHYPVISRCKKGPSFLKGNALLKWNEAFQKNCDKMNSSKITHSNLLWIQNKLLNDLNLKVYN